MFESEDYPAKFSLPLPSGRKLLLKDMSASTFDSLTSDDQVYFRFAHYIYLEGITDIETQDNFDFTCKIMLEEYIRNGTLQNYIKK
jgi:hypothetical protein